MDDKQKTPIILYIVSGLSFIPIYGIIFGLIAILFGAIGKYKNKILIIVGSCGILFSIIMFSSLYYFGVIQRGGTFDRLSVHMAESQLTNIVRELEYHKIQNGRYPDSLKHLGTKNSFVSIYDPILAKIDTKKSIPFYYYELKDSGYYLFSAGFDGTPFTDDDILPKITCEEARKIGIPKCTIDSLKSE
jgi:ABC-type transport system involved in multi-copper enzyme maturation permease subunit